MAKSIAFTLMWQSLLDSSVWLSGTKEERLVWVTMLLLKDADGVVRNGIPGIAHRAVVDVEECRKAINKLSAPDEDTFTQEHQGRRIKRVADGWLILNHEKYRTSEDIRAKWRKQKADQRARKDVENKPDLIRTLKANAAASQKHAEELQAEVDDGLREAMA